MQDRTVATRTSMLHKRLGSQRLPQLLVVHQLPALLGWDRSWRVAPHLNRVAAAVDHPAGVEVGHWREVAGRSPI